MWATEETGIATPLAEPFFHLLDFGVHEKDICTIRVTSLLSMFCLFLGYSFEPGLIAVRLVQRAQLLAAYQ